MMYLLILIKGTNEGTTDSSLTYYFGSDIKHVSQIVTEVIKLLETMK